MPRSRSRAWLVFGGGLTVVMVAVLVAAAVLLRPEPEAAPVLVAPRVPSPPPQVLLAAAAHAPAPTTDGVREAIDALVHAAELGNVSAQVVDAVTGEPLYQHAPEQAVVPASATKLITAATVLTTRGAAHRLPTVAVAGAQSGEVVLVGGGDPTLTVDGDGTYPHAARLDELAAQVREAIGEMEITRVLVDSSLFTGPVHGPWEPSIADSGFAAPITALMTDGARVDPEQVRTPAERFAHPDLAAGEAFARLLGADVPVEYGQAPPTVAAAPTSTPTGTSEPTDAPTGTATPIPGTELGRVWSPPMIRLVEIMLADSDNVIAEALARQVALARGEPASFAGAAEAMTDTLAELGVSMGDSVLADGSGLSRDNRFHATMLTDLLLTALEQEPLASIFSGLPVGGWSGTLAERYRTPQPQTASGAGVVRAKTGTLNGVNTLTGLVVTADGRLLVFALLANDTEWWAYDQLDRIAATLATCGCR